MKLKNLKKEPYKIHLPGFIVENEIGLGDVIKRATSSIGIKPCNECEKRASIFNNIVVFTRKKISY